MIRCLIAMLSLYALLFGACSEEADFAETTPIALDPLPETQQAGPAVASKVDEINPPPPNTHSISAQTRETTEDSNPVELLFILDNSQSMAVNIRDLQVKVPQLFAKLKESNVAYNARILTLDRFLDQLVVNEDPRFIGPVGVFRNGQPDYTRGLGFDDKYLEVTPFSQDFAVEDIASAFENAILTNRAIDNEPGICAAMDYINWVSFTSAISDRRLRFKDEQNLHVILLSDEDNARVFEDRDLIDNRIREKLDIYCYQKRSEVNECKRFNVKLDWTGFGYRWQEKATTQYSYEVDYYEPSLCQQRGVSFPGGQDEFINIIAKEQCKKTVDSVTCDDTTQPSYQYACATPTETFSEPFDVNKEALGTQRCNAIQQFECEVWNLNNGTVSYQAKNRSQAIAIMDSTDKYYSCNAGSHNIALKNTDWTNTKQYCERPAKFSCQTYDQQAAINTIELSYDDAVPFDEKLGGESYICSGGDYQARYSDDRSSSHQACKVHTQFECQQWDGNNKVYVDADRATALSIIDNPNPETRYQCSALDVEAVIGVDDISSTKGRCNVPDTVECQTYPDGQLFWNTFSWEEARQLLDDFPDRSCRLKQGVDQYHAIDVDQTSSIYQSQGRYLVQSCEAYSCADVSQRSCRLKSGALASSVLLAVNDPTTLNKDKYYIESCDALTCNKVANTTCVATGQMEWVNLPYPDARTGDSRYMYDKCAVYSCQDEGERECRVPAGVVPSPMDFAANSPQLLDKPKYYIEECENYTCTPQVSGYKRVTITPAQQTADTNRYQNCGAVQSEVTYQPKYVVNVDSGGAFVSLGTNECTTYGAGYQVAPDNTKLNTGNLCKSLVEQKLTAQGGGAAIGVGIEIQPTGEASVQISKEVTTEYSVGSKTKEQLATVLGIKPEAIYNFVGSQQTIQGRLVEQFFAYEKFPPGSNERSQMEAQTMSFAEITVEESPFVGPQTVLLDSPEYTQKYPRNGNINQALTRDDQLWSDHIKETRVEDPKGYFEEGCNDTKVEVTKIRPTAENFVSLMGDLFPKMSFTWHSIVNLDGEKCSPEDTANTAKGTEYLELTKMTKGVSASICETDSEGLLTFLKELALSVINELDLVYELPVGVTADAIAEVVNKTSGKILVRGEDFKFDTSGDGPTAVLSIIFTKGSISENDSIEVRYR